MTGGRRNGLALGLSPGLVCSAKLWGGLGLVAATLPRVGDELQRGQNGEEGMTREGSALMRAEHQVPAGAFLPEKGLGHWVRTALRDRQGCQSAPHVAADKSRLWGKANRCTCDAGVNKITTAHSNHWRLHGVSKQSIRWSSSPAAFRPGRWRSRGYEQAPGGKPRGLEKPTPQYHFFHLEQFPIYLFHVLPLWLNLWQDYFKLLSIRLIHVLSKAGNWHHIFQIPGNKFLKVLSNPPHKNLAILVKEKPGTVLFCSFISKKDSVA